MTGRTVLGTMPDQAIVRLMPLSRDEQHLTAIGIRLKRMIARIWAMRPSRDFWRGYGQAFDLFPVPTKIQGYPHKSEADALREDWRVVEGDLRKAIQSLKAKP